MEITDVLNGIKPLDYTSMEVCRNRWNSLAKPLHGMGRLEDAVIKMAGIFETPEVSLDKKLVVVMCADNGVVEEGVSQSGPDVTKKVSDNFASGKTTANIISSFAGADVWPVDVGVIEDTLIENMKTARGTENMAKGPAMSRQEAQKAIMTGVKKAEEAKEAGYKIIAAGEMGIGNTTTSAAAACVMLSLCPEEAAGRGAGADSEILAAKVRAVKAAIEINRPDKNDPADVLSKVGGFDICAMCGLFLGGALYRLPVIADGLISLTAALCAASFDSRVKDFIFPSHLSSEPAAEKILDALGLEAYLKLDMHLGEGTGAAMMFPLFDIALEIYNKMVTFDEINLEAYREFET